MDRQRLDRYLELLLEKNTVLNLTAAKTLDELRVRHLEDSLRLIELPEVSEARTLLDLGTGGGMPGIPVAIALPSLQVTMIDATRKKVAAVQEFVEQLELPNAQTAAGRAEELAHEPAWRQRFDVVVARAFAPLPAMLEYCAPFCRIGGTVVAFLGPQLEEALEPARGAMKALGLRYERAIAYTLRDQTFHLAIFTLSARVPRVYPRGQDLPRKKPL